MSASTSAACIPEDKGRVVVAFLESFFTKYVEYDFTAVPALQRGSNLLAIGPMIGVFERPRPADSN